MNWRVAILGAALAAALGYLWLQKNGSPWGDEERTDFSSVFVPLKGQYIDVPREGREASGGAVTSLGEHILLLAPSGRFHLVGTDGTLAPARIAAPENGYDDYVAVSKRPPYDSYEHRYDWFRFFDVARFQNAAGSGLLVSYMKFHKDRECYGTAIARAMLSAGSEAAAADVAIAAADWVDIFETEPCLPLKSQWRAFEGHMAGGRIAVDDAQGRVLLASGDYAWDGMYGPLSTDPDSTLALAQDPEADYGKVIAIDIATGTAETLSRGHRNMQGIVVGDSGAIWTVEHGPRGGDELNEVRPGRNFGWPLETYGTKYSGLPVNGVLSLGRHETYDQPAHAWLPSIAVSGMTTVRDFHEAWDGDMLVSTLAGQMLVRLRTDQGRLVFAERIVIGKRMRHIHQHSDGTIVVWLDEDSRLLLLRPAEGNLGARFVERYVDNVLDVPEQTRAAVRMKLGECMECHSFTAGDHQGAPSLAEVYRSEVGSTGFDGYSGALSSSRDRWTRERLDAFLKDTRSVYLGTNMPSANISDEKVRSAIIDVLQALKTTQE
jgi:cytochrome c2